MPNFKHIVDIPYNRSFRTAKIEGLFDLDPKPILERSWEVNIPIEDIDWGIGVIVGPSGSGKTTIGRRLFGIDAYHQGFDDWSDSASFIDSFPETANIEEITQVLSSVGFSSPPHWLQPYKTLSMGQRFRVEMARLLFDVRPVVVVDEYTSVVDRTVAKVGSLAMAKTARRMNRRLVLLSCHYDILDWLEPDWIYYVDTAEFVRGSLRRPKINIEIKRCHYSSWRLFREHHYLNNDILPQSECYIALVNGEPAGFFAYVREFMRKKKNLIRGHRSVVLPDFQGLGLGNIVTKKIMNYYTEKGFLVTAITSHPAFISARTRDRDFKLCNRIEYPINMFMTEETKKQCNFKRVKATFQYIGNKKLIEKKLQERAQRYVKN
jgi:ABC-type transport system involved in cytochrome c biogenesis ATPase subunit